MKIDSIHFILNGIFFSALPLFVREKVISHVHIFMCPMHTQFSFLPLLLLYTNRANEYSVVCAFFHSAFPRRNCTLIYLIHVVCIAYLNKNIGKKYISDAIVIIDGLTVLNKYLINQNFERPKEEGEEK